MSGLAEVLLARRIEVSGSDVAESSKTKELQKLGAKITIGHSAKNLAHDTDLVVFSSAIKGQNNPEIVEAELRGIRTVRRADFLGELTRDQKTIAVAGTHGKTTTTSMIAHILIEAGLDPFVSVGARVRELGTKNARAGSGNLALVEADEYDRSFLALHPFIAVLTTLEIEHLDIYADLSEIQEAFVTFANQTTDPNEQGYAIVNIDEESLRNILGKLYKRIVTFGITSAEAKYRATEIQSEGLGTHSIIYRGADAIGQLSLSIPGSHNIMNALAAIAVAEVLAIPFEISQKALASFIGAERRSEMVGEVNGIFVMDDYAHHPTEVRATLEALRLGYPGRRIVAAFQPHTFSRTRDFAKDFGRVFAECSDVLWLLDVYPAREKSIDGVTSKLILNAAIKCGMKDCRIVGSLEELPEAMTNRAEAGDIFITLGAGSITDAASKIFAALKTGVSDGKISRSDRSHYSREKVA